jgi:hypothetical protein
MFELHENSFNGTDQTAGAGSFLEGMFGDLMERCIFKLEIDAIGFEVSLLSNNYGTFGVTQNLIQILFDQLPKDVISSMRFRNSGLKMRSISSWILALNFPHRSFQHF